MCARQTCFCGALCVFDQSAEPIKISGRDRNGDAGSHAADSHAASPPGILPEIQMSDTIREVAD